MTAPDGHGLLREQITTAPEEVECRHCGHWMHNHDGTGCTVVTGDTEWTVGVASTSAARVAHGQRRYSPPPEEPPPTEDWIPCCGHCGCLAGGVIGGLDNAAGEGHDDTCAHGCNDNSGEVTDEQ